MQGTSVKTFIEQAMVYSQYHESKRTLYFHLVGVPLALLGVMIFLGCFKLILPGVFQTTLAILATLALFVYYLRQQWQLALLILPILMILLWLSWLISYEGPTHFALWFFVITSLIGWGILIFSHVMEGKKPAFTHQFSQILIAPLVLIAEVCFLVDFMKALKEQIHGSSIIFPQEPHEDSHK